MSNEIDFLYGLGAAVTSPESQNPRIPAIEVVEKGNAEKLSRLKSYWVWGCEPPRSDGFRDHHWGWELQN
ncbi:hypothetical protein N7471_005325 [Penicillium samsonianum]|uniref:uncharacterized protein n=1 Tax=Penicillium samsonianum TaxID=1882272 RepID=UPI00254843B1|nr:uncharacterized protein N7471_005325 [Penicillium samsonianum]KAJ6138839.1 hypothetical protein N7471_005325 [Penicillium samsonianum]